MVAGIPRGQVVLCGAKRALRGQSPTFDSMALGPSIRGYLGRSLKIQQSVEALALLPVSASWKVASMPPSLASPGYLACD